MSSVEDTPTNQFDFSSSSRTFDEIDKVFEEAHVETENLKPLYQSLWFGEKTHLEENLFLLGLDKNLLTVLKEGQSLVIRGDKDEEAVICTDNQTFSLQVAEISNSVALVPDIVWSANANGSSEERVIENKNVEKILYEYFEVTPTWPKLGKVMSLLEPSCYKGADFEESYKKKGVEFKSTRDLLMRVQASESELLQALRDNCACFLNGHWRLLDRDYHQGILSDILEIVGEKFPNLDGIIREEIVNLLPEEYPIEIVNHLLDWYCEKTDDCDSDGRTKWTLREDRVCRFLGEVILRLASQKFNLKEFFSVWQETVPKGMKVDLKYLDGIALKDDQTKPPSIFFFPEWELPADIGERFKVLFSTKPKWLMDEIKPFIVNLTTSRMNVNALLTKHALGSNSDGKRWYSARHGKD